MEFLPLFGYSNRMRRFAVLLSLLALPLAAEQHDPTPDEPMGRDLMGEALRLFMQGLMSEMEPALDDLSELLGEIDSYHPPEMLPNGDIIIRRKTPLGAEPDVGEDGEVEL